MMVTRRVQTGINFENIRQIDVHAAFHLLIRRSLLEKETYPEALSPSEHEIRNKKARKSTNLTGEKVMMNSDR